MWNPIRIEPAAHIALYPPCDTTYIDNTEVSDHPIRMFHGISDDYVEIGSCRSYLARLRKGAKDIKMTEFPDTWHAYDYPDLPPSPTIVPNGQIPHCALKEEPVGTIINVETAKAFDQNDDCVGRNPHVVFGNFDTRNGRRR